MRGALGALAERVTRGRPAMGYVKAGALGALAALAAAHDRKIDRGDPVAAGTLGLAAGLLTHRALGARAFSLPIHMETPSAASFGAMHGALEFPAAVLPALAAGYAVKMFGPDAMDETAPRAVAMEFSKMGPDGETDAEAWRRYHDEAQKSEAPKDDSERRVRDLWFQRIRPRAEYWYERLHGADPYTLRMTPEQRIRALAEQPYS